MGGVRTSERRRDKIRGEKVRRKEMQAREKVEKLQFTVFSDDLLLWPAEKEASSLKTKDEKFHTVMARNTFPSQM